MEQEKPEQDPPTQNPNPGPNLPAPAPPPPPLAAAAACAPAKGKKRSFDSYNVQIQECSYFKIRAVVKDIRPHLLEVLRTVEFRSCKGADELRDRLKLLMELYKQMTVGAVTTMKCKNAPEAQHLSSENGAGQKPLEQLHDVKHAEQPQSDQVFSKPSENREAIELEEESSYVGGSAFGWNFITYPGNKPVYYGRTKESYRAAQVAA